MLVHYDPSSLHVYKETGRFYRVDEENYPGVGTVLNATDSPTQQEFWRKWRSHPENIEYSDRAKNRGKTFHGMIESHFRTGNYRADSQDDAAAIAEPFWQSVQEILPKIRDIQLIESAVWHPVCCYAGTVDMVCRFDEQPVILDWKTAARPKKPEWLGHYPLQLTAYCGAINRMYSTTIQHGVIIMGLPEAQAQVFHFDLGDYWVPWLARLVGYWEQQATPLAAKALELIHSEYSALPI